MLQEKILISETGIFANVIAPLEESGPLCLSQVFTKKDAPRIRASKNIRDMEIALQMAMKKISDKDKIINEQKKKLFQMQSFEHFEIFVNKIVHDLNNLLLPVAYWAESIAEEPMNIQEMQEAAKIISKAVQKMNDLTRKISRSKHFSQEEDREEICLDSIVNEILDIIRISTPLNIKIVKNIISKRKVSSNRTDVEQIIINLIVNAIDAMKEMKEKDGLLTVELLDFDFDFPYLELKVSDTGVGIPDKIMGKIFDPFFSTKSKKDISGLGLSVVNENVKKIGGKIKIESIPGKGTSFSIFFPAC